MLDLEGGPGNVCKLEVVLDAPDDVVVGALVHAAGGGGFHGSSINYDVEEFTRAARVYDFRLSWSYVTSRRPSSRSSRC